MSSVRPSPFLKLSLQLDAAGSAALGALQVAAAPALAAWLQLPRSLVFEVGLVMLPYALALTMLARRASVPAAAVKVIVSLNLLWAVGAGVVFAVTSPSAWGVSFVALHVAWVLAFAALQARGLAQSPRLPRALAAAR